MRLTSLCAFYLVSYWFFDVPLGSACLISIGFVCQMAIGVRIIKLLLPSMPVTTLLMVGPALILGGAASTIAYQVLNRGILAMTCLSVVALFSLQFVVNQNQVIDLRGVFQKDVIHILGLSVLALSSDFEQLFPIVVVIVLLTPVFQLRRKSIALRTIVCLGLIGILLVSRLYRSKLWWVVTDDYNFLEALSLHLTTSGVNSSFSMLNPLRYHWLSYGWTGLMSVIGSTDQPFTVLTQVMPFAYATSLAASLLLICRAAIPSHLLHRSNALLAWVTIAIFPIQWTGLSTAAVYAVLAAFCALLIGAKVHIEPLWRRLVTYSLFLPIVALTKPPSLFAAIFSVALFETALSLQRQKNFKLQGSL